MKFRLYNGGGATNYAASQNAYSQYVRRDRPYGTWKKSDNNKTLTVSKFIKNDLPGTVKDCTNNCQFVANPIKHYRKQYVNLSTTNQTGFSNHSLIGTLDIPGFNNITSLTCSDLSLNQLGYEYILDVKDVTCRDKCFVIKRASTVIDTSMNINSIGYSQTHNEYLWKKCKTFKQNLPLVSAQNNMTDCSKTNNRCNAQFSPSNKKYQTQGPVTSSARIAALRYCADESVSKRCTLPTTDYNKFGTKYGGSDFDNLKVMPGCVGCPPNRKSRTRILA